MNTAGSTKFPTEQQFVSHVGLAPHKPISGGNTLKRKRKPGSASARVGAALRMAALTMRHSQTALGGDHRQIARRAGADVAVFATARKLAQLIYRLLRWGTLSIDEGAAAYEKRYREARVHRQPRCHRERFGLHPCFRRGVGAVLRRVTDEEFFCFSPDLLTSCYNRKNRKLLFS